MQLHERSCRIINGSFGILPRIQGNTDFLTIQQPQPPRHFSKKNVFVFYLAGPSVVP